MRIVLLRHGKPDLPAFGSLTASDMGRWIACYDAAGIIPDTAAMARAAEIAANCNAIVTSDLPRAIASANALAESGPWYSDPLFREMPLPHGDWKRLRLPPKLWAAIFRMLWLAGFASHAESVNSSRRRAKAAAFKLQELASEHRSILLVGHGIMNHFIARELLTSGWRGPKHPARGHWQFSIYRSDVR